MKLVKQLGLLESNHHSRIPEFKDLAKDLGLKVELLSDERLIAYFIKRGIKGFKRISKCKPPLWGLSV